MSAKALFASSLQTPVVTSNETGASSFVILCDHASNRIPDRYEALGLNQSERIMHIAWDPGALAVSKTLSMLLDAPLVQSTFSRLLADPNRAPDAHDLIPEISENTKVPANVGISSQERAHRIAAFHTPYHQEINDLLDQRAKADRKTILVSMHSFTATYKGVARPWPIGLIHGSDTRFSKALYDALVTEDSEMHVGWNEPYIATQGIYHTTGIHGDERQLHSTMVEIRNNEIQSRDGVSMWAHKMARCLQVSEDTLGEQTL